MIGEIIIGIILVAIAIALYSYKLHKISYVDYAKALDRHYKAAKFVFSAKLAKELFFLLSAVLFVALISFLQDETKSLEPAQHWLSYLVKSIYAKIINPYTLLTSIAGAFIALLLNYLFIHPKAFLHPDAMYELERDGIRKLKFFVENQSLFDCTHVHIEAYKSVKLNDNETFIEPLKFRVTEIASLGGIMSNFNDKTIVFTISEDSLTQKDLKDPTFDDIEVNVSLTHSLSNVTKSITRHYGIEDIYCVTNEKDVMKVDMSKYNDVYLHTLKEGGARRFASARRVVHVFLVLLLILVGIYLCDFKIVNSHLQYLMSSINVVAYVILVFSIIRLIFHFEIKTDPLDKNAAYRINQLQ